MDNQIIQKKYCLYARKSSEEDERQALSIDSQIKEMMQIAEKEGLDIVDIKKESHSAKESSKRDVFNSIISDLKNKKFNSILTWNTDRLSRNAGDLGSLIDLVDKNLLVEIKTYNQVFKNTPNDKFMLMILGGQAKLENDNKSINVKRGLRAKVEQGLWPAVAPTGYLNDLRKDRTGCIHLDPDRSNIIREIFEKVAYDNYSGRKIFNWLKDINFKTKSGKDFSLSNIYLMLNNTFYYGYFEYP